MRSRSGHFDKLRTGFTLIEILVAFAVLVVFTFGVFTMLSRFSRAGALGQWRSTCNAQVRKAQERLRQNVEGASYPMKITPQSNQISDLPVHYVIVNPDGSAAQDDTETQVARIFGPADESAGPNPAEEQVVLKLVKSKPGREGLGGAAPDKEVEATQVSFVLKDATKIHGGKYKWSRTLYMVEEYKSVPTSSFTSSSPFDFSGGRKDTTLLVNDVNRIRVAVNKDDLPAGASTSPSPVLVEIQLMCVEPAYGQAEVISNTKAMPNAGVDIK